MTESSSLRPETRDAFSASETVPAGGCPASEEVWAAAAGEADPATVRRILLHVGECGACTTAWRLAVEMSQVVPLLSEAGERASPSRARWARWTSAGSLLALAAGLAVFVYVETTRPGPVPRDAVTYRGAAPSEVQPLVADGAELPRHDCRLRWTAGPEGSRYDLRVFTPDLTDLVTPRGLTEPEFLVPTDVLEGVAPGTALYWQVTLVLPDGTRRASPVFRVTVR